MKLAFFQIFFLVVSQNGSLISLFDWHRDPMWFHSSNLSTEFLANRYDFSDKTLSLTSGSQINSELILIRIYLPLEVKFVMRPAESLTSLNISRPNNWET